MKRILIAALLATTATTTHAQNPFSCAAQRNCAQFQAKHEARDAEILRQAELNRAQCRANGFTDQFSCENDRIHGAEIRAYKQAERDREAIAAADRARADQQAAQRTAELIKQNEERARVAAMPSTQLLAGYMFFSHVNWCHDVRDGYAYKYINDIELERAQIAVKAIVAQTTKEDTTINTDDVWQRAVRTVEPYTKQRNSLDGFVEVCQHSLRELFKLSPEPTYFITKP